MKTIEERAKEYTHRYATPFLSGLETAEFEAYKAGATEQIHIDIEKACAWLKEHSWDVDPYGTLRVSINLDDFRKAMEEDNESK